MTTLLLVRTFHVTTEPLTIIMNKQMTNINVKITSSHEATMSLKAAATVPQETTTSLTIVINTPPTIITPITNARSQVH